MKTINHVIEADELLVKPFEIDKAQLPFVQKDMAKNLAPIAFVAMDVKKTRYAVPLSLHAMEEIIDKMKDCIEQFKQTIEKGE